MLEIGPTYHIFHFHQARVVVIDKILQKCRLASLFTTVFIMDTCPNERLTENVYKHFCTNCNPNSDLTLTLKHKNVFWKTK